MLDAKRAALYNRHGVFVKMMSVNPNLTAIVSDGVMFLLRAELAGVLRFHEQVAEDPTTPDQRDIITPDDVRFLRSLKITPWGTEVE